MAESMTEREATPEYLAGVRAALKTRTDALIKFGGNKWTDDDLDAYTKDGGWGDFERDGYTPDQAVAEDMTYWDD